MKLKISFDKKILSLITSLLYSPQTDKSHLDWSVKNWEPLQRKQIKIRDTYISDEFVFTERPQTQAFSVSATCGMRCNSLTPLETKQYSKHRCNSLTFMKALFSRAFIMTGGMAVNRTTSQVGVSASIAKQETVSKAQNV